MQGGRVGRGGRGRRRRGGGDVRTVGREKENGGGDGSRSESGSGNRNGGASTENSSEVLNTRSEFDHKSRGNRFDPSLFVQNRIPLLRP